VRRARAARELPGPRGAKKALTGRSEGTADTFRGADGAAHGDRCTGV